MPVWEKDLLLAQLDADDKYADDVATAERAGMSVTELRAVRGG